MLRKAKDLQGYRIEASDGDAGKILNFYFDDRTWAVRYLVADTGRWLAGRQVRVPSTTLGRPQQKARRLPVTLTREQVANSPQAGADTFSLPEKAGVEDWPVYYWPGTVPFAAQAGTDRPGLPKKAGVEDWPAYYWPGTVPFVTQVDGDHQEREMTFARDQERDSDPHLRSTTEVVGYYVQARDGRVGHVDDFLVDDEAWVIRFLVVNTRPWLSGRKVLLTPAWVDKVSWAWQAVHVRLRRDSVRNSPLLETLAIDGAGG